jgi:hypothetical protein
MRSGWLAPTLIFVVLVALMPVIYGLFKKRIREAPISDDTRVRQLRFASVAESGAIALFGIMAVVSFVAWVS